MQNELSVSDIKTAGKPITAKVTGYHAILALNRFKAHLRDKGRVCLKPWCWRRFYILYNPGIEPPWLSAWWSTSREEKEKLFLRQLEMLADQPDRFHAACEFLHRLGDDHWVYE